VITGQPHDFQDYELGGISGFSHSINEMFPFLGCYTA